MRNITGVLVPNIVYQVVGQWPGPDAKVGREADQGGQIVSAEELRKHMMGSEYTLWVRGRLGSVPHSLWPSQSLGTVVAQHVLRARQKCGEKSIFQRPSLAELLVGFSPGS